MRTIPKEIPEDIFIESKWDLLVQDKKVIENFVRDAINVRSYDSIKSLLNKRAVSYCDIFSVFYSLDQQNAVKQMIDYGLRVVSIKDISNWLSFSYKWRHYSTSRAVFDFTFDFGMRAGEGQRQVKMSMILESENVVQVLSIFKNSSSAREVSKKLSDIGYIVLLSKETV